MLLSDLDLADAVAQGRLLIRPFDPAAIQPASIDMHLGPRFQVFDGHLHEVIDPEDPPVGLTRPYTVPAGQCYILHPGELVLGATAELVTLPPSLAARIEGKSTLGRLGLSTHSTAGWIDPGYTGVITLEMGNNARLPIRLRPGMPIGQLCVFTLTSPARRPYGDPGLRSRYQGQLGPVPARRRPPG